MSEHNNSYQAMTVGSWLLTWLLLAIPIVNVICIILWICGVGNKSRVSFARSFLVIILIAVALVAAFGAQILTWLQGLVV